MKFCLDSCFSAGRLLNLYAKHECYPLEFRIKSESLETFVKQTTGPNMSWYVTFYTCLCLYV